MSCLKNADLALSRAKVDGPGNSRFFEREMDERMRARHKLEHDMRVALREDQFELYYQPQLNLESGEIAGFEALLRWNHPERGLILPTEFVPLGRGDGLHRAARRMGAARGLRRGLGVAEAHARRRQSVGGAVPLRAGAPIGDFGAGRFGTCRRGASSSRSPSPC